MRCAGIEVKKPAKVLIVDCKLCVWWYVCEELLEIGKDLLAEINLWKPLAKCHNSCF